MASTWTFISTAVFLLLLIAQQTTAATVATATVDSATQDSNRASLRGRGTKVTVSDPTDLITNRVLSDGPQDDADTCVMLDFNTLPDGTKPPTGMYVRREWQTQYGVAIKASGGHHPRGKARIIDTTNPGRVAQLGSPNKYCDTNPGMGRGLGGRPGEEGANCESQGNALIIQDPYELDIPQDFRDGGNIIFYFESPVSVQSIGMLDITSDRVTIKLYRDDGTRVNRLAKSLGNNSYQSVPVNVDRVTKAQIRLPGNGAITHIHFCPLTTAAADGSVSSIPSFSPSSTPSSVPSGQPTASPVTESPGKTHGKSDGHLVTRTVVGHCVMNVMRQEHFEDGTVDGKVWKNAKLNNDDDVSGLTKFLGKYRPGDSFPNAKMPVPRDADYVRLAFDYYEMGSGSTTLAMTVDGERVHFQAGNAQHKGMAAPDDTGTISGRTFHGISWEVKTKDTTATTVPNVQVQHVIVTIPRRYYSKYGLLRFRLEARGTDTVAGYDNFYLTSIYGYDCDVFGQGTKKDTRPPLSPGGGRVYFPFG